MKSWHLNTSDKNLVALALAEDLTVAWQDITTQTLFTESRVKQAIIKSKSDQPLVMCGMPVVQEIVSNHNALCQLECLVAEGETIAPYANILTLNGDAQVLLMIERVLLNFLQHLIAIATYTARFVAAVQGTQLQILDTRKTTPGWRHLEKMAVYCGGGVNHRMGLYDAIMVKDTHVDMLGGMEHAIAKLPALNSIPVIIEVRNLEELQIVLQQGHTKVSRVLLDNMSLQGLSQAASLCRDKIPTEASGNISLQTVTDIAATGVDYASVGALTHSAPHVDLSMQESHDD